MAQLIAPEVWQMGIDDNRLLPGRHTTALFTGSGVKIANNASACRVWDIQISDYITTYDDRRLNGLAGPRGNSNGNDGWAASAYGVFQDVRFDSRVYTMGRHRSIAMRVFDEMQYAGNIGEWGDASMSYEVTNGNALMQTAAILSKARELWEKQILGPDIDRYNIFCACNGHISGRAICGEDQSGTWVSLDDQIFVNDASKVKWIAQPGMVQGESIPPRFAPIHAIQWDDDNIPLLLQNIKVTWNELHIPETQRVICIDPFYEYRLLSVLTGSGIPATDSAYSDIQNGSFTRLMGWDFNFEIPSSYWPKIYVDDNMNVVHSADGGEAYDSIINSVDGSAQGDAQLLYELGAADRMSRMNFVRTEWIPEHTEQSGGQTVTVPAGFKKVITNYPLGEPAYNGYYGLVSAEIGDWYAYEGTEQGSNTPRTIIPDSLYGVYHAAAGLPGADYPWAGPGVGYGLKPFDVNELNPGDNMATGPQIAGDEATLAQVIGLALYKPAVQLSQEYSSMVTDDGGTRGKFSEMCMDVKYDAWVIEQFAAGVIPIIAGTERKTYSIPVSIVEPVVTVSDSADDGGADDGGNDGGGEGE